MRSHTKGDEPAILVASRDAWDLAFAADPSSSTARYRYREETIKTALLQETYDKCVYCESKLGHNTPGDVEHKIPTSADRTRHFDWSNLTIACTECNRRKGPYDTLVNPFLDPYVDAVEDRVYHMGPVAYAVDGDEAAEVTVRKLELGKGRYQLAMRKIEKIDEISNLRARIRDTPPGGLRDLLEADLAGRSRIEAEFSAMVRSLPWR